MLELKLFCRPCRSSLDMIGQILVLVTSFCFHTRGITLHQRFLVELDDFCRDCLLTRAKCIDAMEVTGVPDPGATNGIMVTRETRGLHMIGLLESDMPLADICNDCGFVLTLVSHHGMDLIYASSILRNTKGIVIAAVRNDGWSLQYASDTLRLDHKVVIEAVKQNPDAIEFADPALHGDREFEFALATLLPNSMMARNLCSNAAW